MRHTRAMTQSSSIVNRRRAQPSRSASTATWMPILFRYLKQSATVRAGVATQAALDAGIKLKVSLEAIKPILAIEYPLPASRPMNSRMDNSKLRLALEQIGDMSKLQHWNEAWLIQVQSYVIRLAKDGLI